ncbi:hypothetical protein BJ684DRAFT_17337 [Piptocephalis cylindrospora]|uniref:Pentacotripeptide-repeat region of PRORP domain-containing protein n=1 Tax=Piptocephalis cylindrospora TaxID=1907219 RepID=A0A4V1IXT2_9FUNG|nr:hypothetical protein BJ684DRAFT_17337 [Piptocephalis cylindrospora]|eukprot:RKP12149.1 hypothetical protein BJ684DRAFT_17337 [Piptocephalis cylindrospora]
MSLFGKATASRAQLLTRISTTGLCPRKAGVLEQIRPLHATAPQWNRKPRPNLFVQPSNAPPSRKDSVTRLMGKGREAEALELCRRAPVSARHPVVWANLIKSYKDLGKTNAAWSAFNEMKKRGLDPTPATYTMILDALSATSTTKAAERVRSVHQGLMSKGCMSTIHANSLLKAYSLLRDAEAFSRFWDRLCEPLRTSSNPSIVPEELPLPDATSFTYAITYFANEAIRQKDKAGLTAVWDTWALLSSLSTSHDATRWMDSGTVFSMLRACNVSSILDPAEAQSHALAVEKACFPDDKDQAPILDIRPDIRVVWQFMMNYRQKGDVTGAFRCLKRIRAHWPYLSLDWPFWAGMSGMVREMLPRREGGS